MRKTLFITGTVNNDIIEEIVKLLDYVGYDAFYGSGNDIDDDDKNIRIRGILDSDGLLCYGDNIGRNHDVFQKELEIAQYLNIPIIYYERFMNLSDIGGETLESLVAKKVLLDAMEKEEERTDENHI